MTDLLKNEEQSYVLFNVYSSEPLFVLLFIYENFSYLQKFKKTQTLDELNEVQEKGKVISRYLLFHCRLLSIEIGI